MRRRRGLVLGKFLPPHLGHLFLVEFARHHVERLTVVVGTLAREPIPGALRFAWMRELCPDVDVVHLTDENPQEPAEHPDFWRIWHDSLMRVLPEPPDLVFASETYGYKLAEVLGAELVMADLARTIVPVSGTAVRRDPFAHWRFLPRCVRPYFTRRVCVFGPESSGKTTLARALAAQLGTVMVPEYARGYLEARGGQLAPGDFDRIARGQLACEEALARDAERVLVCDTDLLTTRLWAEELTGDCPEWIRQEADRRSYDLYLVCEPDIPFVADPVRYRPDGRERFLARGLEALAARGRSLVRISGSPEQRLARAGEAVAALLTPR